MNIFSKIGNFIFFLPFFTPVLTEKPIFTPVLIGVDCWVRVMENFIFEKSLSCYCL